jgi:hypothetical protein
MLHRNLLTIPAKTLQVIQLALILYCVFSPVDYLGSSKDPISEPHHIPGGSAIAANTFVEHPHCICKPLVCTKMRIR